MIYFDNAATTLKKPDGVAQAVSDAIMNLGMQEEVLMMHLYIVCEWPMKRENY